jgi:hypothetical protein
MRVTRREPGDHEKAQALLDEAVATAREVGMRAVEEKVSNLRSLVHAWKDDVPALETADRKSHPHDHGIAPSERQPETIFRNDGEYWTITYAGSVVRLKDCRGLQYIASLLSRPGQEMLALDLIQGSIIGEHISRSRNRGNQGLEKGNQRIPLLDAKARTAYAGRLKELREELEEAERHDDVGRIGPLRDEIEIIGEQLAAAVGLGGRNRTAADATERARIAVTKRIKAAIRRIASSAPELGRYLRITIKTGAFCAYVPDPKYAVTWKL